MGFSVLEKPTSDSEPKILHFGTCSLPQTVLAYGSYPFCYVNAALEIQSHVISLVQLHKPDVIVIEETNLGRNRYSQKMLEFIHCVVAQWLSVNFSGRTVYISSSVWRQKLGLQMTKDDKKRNSNINKIKKQSKDENGKIDLKKFNQLKKTSGFRGKVTQKHIALRYVDTVYGIKLKSKDNDQADAICLALAFFMGATPCDGM
ncbi:hypothetical protein EBT16_01125 [bacterium]|nr:hypothetical protein [bacterium]